MTTEFERLGEEEIREARRYHKGKIWRGPDGKIIPGKREAAGRWLDRKSSNVQRVNLWVAVIGIVVGALIGATSVYLAM